MMTGRAALLSVLVLGFTVPAGAEVTSFNVLDRSSAALQGRSFGASGQVETIRQPRPYRSTPPILTMRSSPISTARRAMPTAK